MDHTLTRNETGRKTNLAKHYRARVFEKKGGRPYARLREAVRFTLWTGRNGCAEICGIQIIPVFLSVPVYTQCPKKK